MDNRMILDSKQKKKMVKIRCSACDKSFGMHAEDIETKYPNGGLLVFCSYCGVPIRINLN